MMNRRDERLSADRAALVIVDMQERLMAAMPDPSRLAEHARRLVVGARHLGVPAVLTEQAPAKLGPTVAPLRELLHYHPGSPPLRTRRLMLELHRLATRAT